MHPLLYKIKRFYRKEKLPDPLAYLYKWFGITPEGVLQIGANNGQEVKKFAVEGIRYGVFVEPLPKAFEQLQNAVSRHPDYLAINALCASEAGLEKSFFVSEKAGGSSSMLKPTGHLEIHPEVGFDNELVLRTSTVDEIVKKLLLEGHEKLVDKLDLLYIDVQGAELDVLKGAEQFLTKAKFVFAEVSHGGLYEGDTSIRHIIDFLEGHKFKLAFTYINKHGWGDALFIKESFFGQR
ncbi:MAG: FkbM family methyltransferase [Gallionella sp.]|nr:FkbM family methyltransferase [Gallionella sp.]